MCVKIFKVMDDQGRAIFDALQECFKIISLVTECERGAVNNVNSIEYVSGTSTTCRPAFHLGELRIPEMKKLR